MVAVPDFAPFVFGENVMLMVQFAFGATVVPHVDVTPNWPVAFIAAIFNSDVPVLVRVTVCGALVVLVPSARGHTARLSR
jgi:hypothetical protein